MRTHGYPAVMQKLESLGVEPVDCYDYAEPGYRGAPLLGYWSTVSDESLLRALEEHFELEWWDEWMTCDCGKIFRTAPDSYHWQLYGGIYDGWVECGDCITADPTTYEEWLRNNSAAADTVDVDWAARGWNLLLEDFENGWYYRNDNPVEIAAKFKKSHPDCDWLFALSGVEQFRTNFVLWYKR